MDNADHRAVPPQPGSFLYPSPAIAAVPAPGGSTAIILRTRDRPLLLGRALRGILAQTHADWHLYLVNDGGDPAPVEALLAREATALAGRATLLHRNAPPHGPWPAAQAGLEATQDEGLVCLHDDDDSWEPGFLAAVAGFLTDPAHAGFVAVSTGCTLVEEEIAGDAVRERWRCPWPHNRGLVDFRAALADAQIPPICLAIRRDALIAAGSFDPRLRFAGDWEALLRLLLLGDIGHLDAPLANYHHRVRGSGAAYGNTVVEQRPARQDQQVMLRNAMLRAGLRDRPEALGLLQALLAAQAEADPRARLDALAAAIGAVQGDAAASRAALAAMRTEAEAARARAEAAQAQAARAAAEAASGRAAILAALASLREETAALRTGLDARLGRIEGDMAALRQVAAWHTALLRPLRGAWHRGLPLRRLVARLRGRVPPPAPRPARRLPPEMQRRLIDLPLIGPRIHRQEMIRRYTGYHGRPPQLDPPLGFNAHMIARILHDRDPRLKVLCDKVAIRPLIRDALGEALLPPLLGAWDDPAEVPWESLPLPFVMKPSHASGLIYVVRTPEEMVPAHLAGMAAEWLSRDYFDSSFEWGYRGIPRRLLIQPLFVGPDGDTPAEAQVFTFGGRASHVRVFTGGRDGTRRRDNWFDPEARRVPMHLSSPMGDYVLDPALARRLVAMGETMARDHIHLRVDFLLTDAGPKLIELTAYTFAGAMDFHPREMDLEFGRLWEEGAARLAARRRRK